METKPLFDEKTSIFVIELIYDADRSLMPASQLGQALVGMSTCLKLAGRFAALDFEDIYISPLEEGSVKAIFRFGKKDRKDILVQATGTILGTLILAPFQLIGQYGLAALKNPTPEIMTSVDKKIIEMCMNGEYRKSITKIAQPISELNQKATIKVDNKSYEITCENQYKFIVEDQDPILPMLINGETVTLIGRLTRINLDQNDLGFEYEGRKISIFPADPEKAVGKEFHQFLANPMVRITGIVVRPNEFVVPEIKVIRMEEDRPKQTSLLEEASNPTK